MSRLSIDFTEEDMASLKEIAEERGGCSVSSLVRLAYRQFIKEETATMVNKIPPYKDED